MKLSRKSKKKYPYGPRESWRVSTLVKRAIKARDEDGSWKYISVLHWRGTREVFDAAAELCKSKKIKERCLGADILGQVGVPERKFPEEALKILYGMLKTETNPDVLYSVLVAIGHTQDLKDMHGINKIIILRNHKNSRVRYGVVLALSGREDKKSLYTLIKLTEDPDSDVRDWATFGLGTQTDLDTPRIRKALWRRVNDKDSDTRGEAIVGLVKRKVPGIKNILVKELNQEDPSSLIFEATAEYSDPPLLEKMEDHLRIVRGKKDIDKMWLYLLKRAIKDLRGKLRAKN